MGKKSLKSFLMEKLKPSPPPPLKVLASVNGCIQVLKDTFHLATIS